MPNPQHLSIPSARGDLLQHFAKVLKDEVVPLADWMVSDDCSDEDRAHLIELVGKWDFLSAAFNLSLLTVDPAKRKKERAKLKQAMTEHGQS